MEGADFVRDIRFILGDLPERSSTSSLMWETDEILVVAAQCQDTLIKTLWNQQRSHEQPFQMAVTSVLKSINLASAQPLPSDYWHLLCAVNAGEYLPADTTERARALLGMGDRLITVQAGVFVAPADAQSGKIYYVSLPKTKLPKTGTFSTQFSDSFYECLELLTCLALLGKKERGALDLMMFLAKEIATAIPTLV